MIPRRRSRRIMEQEIADVATDGVTDYPQAFQEVVGLGQQMSVLVRALGDIAAAGTTEDLDLVAEHLMEMKRLQLQFCRRHPNMFRINHCREMLVMFSARLQYCWEVLEMAEMVQEEEQKLLTAGECARLPEHTPAKDAICSICCCTGDTEWVKLRCGHAFHRSCATEWLSKHQATCPLCRTSVKPA